MDSYIPYTAGFDPEAAKIACLNLLKKEGVRLRLHSWVVAPMLDGSRVTGRCCAFQVRALGHHSMNRTASRLRNFASYMPCA